jgi:long-subunit acyl-CoA synthetase (AMP-forming)
MAYAQVLLAEDIRPKMSDPAVRKQVTSQLEGLLAEVNRTVEHHEQLAFLAVVAEEWTTSNGFLTPTMKIRRGAIEDATSDKIEGWYGAGEKVVWA